MRRRHDASGHYGAHYSFIDTVQLGPGRSATIARAFGTGYVTNDPASPMMGAAGPCLMMIEVIDGKPGGMARCHRRDPDGDEFLVLGTTLGAAPGGGLHGTWTIEGISGKWVGAHGEGTWQDAGAANAATHYFISFTGWVELEEDA